METVRLDANPNILVLAGVIAIAVVSILQSGCTSCGVAQSPTPSQRLEAALKRAKALPSVSASSGPVCPLLNASVVLTTPPANGGHRVILTWKASAPPDSTHSAAAGYCIYRTAVGDAQPVLINLTPIPGTSCTDDLVENGKGYSYVVRAISATDVPSVISNPAPARIPATGQSHLPSGPSATLCRGSANAK